MDTNPLRCLFCAAVFLLIISSCKKEDPGTPISEVGKGGGIAEIDSCVIAWRTTRKHYIPVNKSEGFAAISRGFKIDSTDGLLVFSFAWTAPPGFNYPVSPKSGNQLHETKFILELTADGKEIKAGGGMYQWGWSSFEPDKEHMKDLGKTMRLESNFVHVDFNGRDVVNRINFIVPYVYLNSLSAGLHDLTFHFYQLKFGEAFKNGRFDEGGNDDYDWEETSASLIDHSGALSFYMPPVYKSRITCTRIETTANPPHTFIFSSPLFDPELYWLVESPPSFTYAQSRVLSHESRIVKKKSVLPVLVLNPRDSIYLAVEDEYDGPWDGAFLTTASPGAIKTTLEDIPIDSSRSFSGDLIDLFIAHRDSVVQCN